VWCVHVVGSLLGFVGGKLVVEEVVVVVPVLVAVVAVASRHNTRCKPVSKSLISLSNCLTDRYVPPGS
jgi:hypothetical protein